MQDTKLVLRGGSALVQGQFQIADVLIEAGRIAAVGRELVADQQSLEVDCTGRLVLPGFIDVQVNGGGGRMFSLDVDEESYGRIARAHASVGTTALCPTVISGPEEEMLKAISLVASMCTSPVPGGAAFVGIHVEGPFLAEKKRGGHAAEHLRSPSLAFVKEVIAAAAGHLKIFTIAPELPGALDVVEFLASSGIHVSAGHTAADAEAVHDAMALGLSGVTHIFNAMDPLGSRNPGPVGVAFSSDLYAGLICDFLHVRAETLASTIRAKGPDRVYVTTDAVAGLASEQQTFQLYGVEVSVREGGCYTPEGVLAGTATPVSIMVRNLIRRLGIPQGAASAMASTVPATVIGLSDRGRIAPGCIADILVCDYDFRLSEVIVRGERTKIWQGYAELAA